MIENTNKLKRLYGKLMTDVADYTEDICPFFIQIGKKYFSAPKRLLFVGKATNGWVTNERDVTKLFDLKNPDRIVNRHDQMEWVHDLEGVNENYNTKKSAFWRVIKNVSLDILGKEDWYNYISWTNLYKIAPWEGGNPGGYLQQLQKEACISILNEEQEAIKPDAVIFLTSGWESFYLESIGLKKSKNRVKSWSGYSSTYQIHKDVLYIQSHHPQGKPEVEHKDGLLKILRKVT
ncbi:MAG: hypothetical protein K9L68_12380 [Spirochaetales bacterium]|nr:hypothetical protein [Spirochaetales bacterium]